MSKAYNHLSLVKQAGMTSPLLLMIIGLLMSTALRATPSWSLDQSEYSNSMSFTWQIILDAEEPIEESDQIGVFVGNEIRGVVSALENTSLNEYFFMLLAYSNVNSGETLTFKFYNASTDSVMDMDVTYDFVTDGIEGSISDPLIYSFSTNGSPVADLPAADVFLDTDQPFLEVNLVGMFHDPDGDSLTITASSDDHIVVTTEVVNDQLILHNIGPGTTTVTITANDGRGGSVSDQISVTVNTPPVVSKSVIDLVLKSGFGTVSLNMDGAFSDVNTDILTLSATSDLVTAVTTGLDGDTLLLTEEGAGVATISVTADDGHGGTAVMTFTVEVRRKDAEELPLGLGNMKDGVRCYPNPVSTELTIRVNDQNAEIAVLDQTGKRILLPIDRSDSDFQASFSDQPVGVYFILITDRKETVVERIMKE